MPRKKDPGLALVNLRLRKKDIAAARRRGREFGIPYQHVIRAWVAAMASEGGERLYFLGRAAGQG
jgi:predicted DNA binding CopG/RHH family protein